MIRPGSRLRQIGWAVALSTCAVFFMALTFRVNAVKSEVRLAEREIIALERERILLETEFETRANQQQLADWNRIEFGYRAPAADQYLENERQLASLGLPRNAGAPDPIRVARAPTESEEGVFPQFVSPLTGEPANAATEVKAPTHSDAHQTNGANSLSAKQPLSERLSIGRAIGRGMAETGE
ncbi:MAG: hypothetical protein WAT93_10315 [Pontixanthobacter sp.]